MCALETTEGASSLFDVRFPLPPPLCGAPPTTKEAGSDSDSGAAGGARDDADDAGTPPPAAGRNGDASGGGQKDVGGSGVADADAGAEAVAVAERAGGGGHGVLEEGGVVALVLGNEVTGVDERVLGLCDMVIEASGWSPRGWSGVGWAVHTRGFRWAKRGGDCRLPRQ